MYHRSGPTTQAASAERSYFLIVLYICLWFVFSVSFLFFVFYASSVYRSYHSIVYARRERTLTESNELLRNTTDLAVEMYQFLKVNPSCWWAYGCGTTGATSMTYVCNQTSVPLFRDVSKELLKLDSRRPVEMPIQDEMEDAVREYCDVHASLACLCLFRVVLFYVEYESILFHFSLFCWVCYIVFLPLAWVSKARVRYHTKKYIDHVFDQAEEETDMYTPQYKYTATVPTQRMPRSVQL